MRRFTKPKSSVAKVIMALLAIMGCGCRRSEVVAPDSTSSKEGEIITISEEAQPKRGSATNLGMSSGEATRLLAFGGASWENVAETRSVNSRSTSTTILGASQHRNFVQIHEGTSGVVTGLKLQSGVYGNCGAAEEIAPFISVIPLATRPPILLSQTSNDALTKALSSSRTVVVTSNGISLSVHSDGCEFSFEVKSLSG